MESTLMNNICPKCLCECHCDMDECPNCPNDVCTDCDCTDRQNRMADNASH